MAIYAVGDIQGCYNEFQHLLEQIRFDPAGDQLWLVGDLVNRGPGSLQVLRFVKSLGDRAVTVLGNHDLHLVAVHAGIGKLHSTDTLDEVLNAPDCEELIHWLRRQKLAHYEDGHLLVHAGVLPSWTADQAVALAHEVETVLRGESYFDFIEHMYGNNPHGWSDDLEGYKRLRTITNAFTRLRVCTQQGEMEFKFKGEVPNIPEGYLPWFEVPKRKTRDTTVIFGHWSALGLVHRKHIIALDTGCLWGGPMTAIRLDDRELFQVECKTPVAKHW